MEVDTKDVLAVLARLSRRHRHSAAEGIDAGYLATCAPADAYQWLEERAPKTVDAAQTASFSDREQRLQEYVLFRRNDPHINLALARFALSGDIVRRVFRRGGPGVRLAAWSNVAQVDGQLDFGIWARDAEVAELVRRSHPRELQAFAGNMGLSDDTLVALIRRHEPFAPLKDRSYATVLRALGKNPRLPAPYGRDRPMDGWAESSHDRPAAEAWRVAADAPVTDEIGYALAALLRDLEPPHPSSFDGDLSATLARWQIDPEPKPDDRHPWRGGGFAIRTRLADILPPTADLRDSADPALRMSFLRRFEPARFPDWDERAAASFGRDHDEVLRELMENGNLWRDPEARAKLGSLCWQAPDPNSSMDLPNAFRAVERRWSTKHPEWFSDASRA